MEEFYRGEITRVGDRRVAHGLARRLPQEPESAARRERRDLAAWQYLMGHEYAFTHLTAALLYGLWLPPRPKGMPVFMATRGSRRIQRAGVIASRLSEPATTIEWGPYRVDPPLEMLLRCARDLGVLDVGVLLSSALRSRLITMEALHSLCEGRRPGVRRLRVAAGYSDARFESPGEFLLHAFHVMAEVRVTPQAPLVDRRGVQFGRADLGVDGTPFIHEYDGAVHRSPAQQTRDLRRDRRLIELQIIRRGFVLDDLINHPAVTMAELDRALDRPPAPHRLANWRRLVDESLYSDSGTRRLLLRWIHHPGDTDWSITPGGRA